MITITKDKVYSSPFTLKKTRKDSADVSEVPVAGIISMLGEEVELGEDAVFKNIFDIIIFHKDFLNILFKKEMHGFLIDDFISDYEREPSEIFKNDGFDMRFSWHSEVFEYDKEIEYQDYVAFEAFGRLNPEDQEDYPISIAFISLSEIREKIIFLDNEFELHDEESYKNEIGAIFKANYRPFTLYELISAILQEITYYGNPEQRDSQRKEIEKRIQEFGDFIDEEMSEEHILGWEEMNEEIDEVINDGLDSFWDKIYPKKEESKIEAEVEEIVATETEVSDKSLEAQMKEAEDCEDYETAAKIKKLIDNKKSKK